MRAAEWAMRLLAFEHALAFYESAQRLLEGVGDERAFAEAVLGTGQAWIRIGEIDRGRQACTRAAALARERGDGELFARAVFSSGYEHAPWARNPASIGRLEEALAMIREEGLERVHDRHRRLALASVAQHEGVGLSKMWFEIAAARGIEIRYGTGAVKLASRTWKATRTGRTGAAPRFPNPTRLTRGRNASVRAPNATRTRPGRAILCCMCRIVSTPSSRTGRRSAGRRVRDALMGKTITRSRKYHAHVEEGQFGEGDLVEVVFSRPLSRLKRWRLAEMVRVDVACRAIPWTHLLRESDSPGRVRHRVHKDERPLYRILTSLSRTTGIDLNHKNHGRVLDV